MNETKYFEYRLLRADHIMIFFNNQLLKGCTIALTNFLSILIVNHVIRLTIHKQGRHCTFSNIL